MLLLEATLWTSLGALLWTHLLYPLAAAVLARLRPRPARSKPILPTVTVIVAAHDEEQVIGRRLENLLALDYPADRLGIVVASDASTDRTDGIVEQIGSREPRVSLLRCSRGGKVAAQDSAAREAGGEILAFSDANASWAAGALRALVKPFADPDVAYVCGRLSLLRADGTNLEGLYWRLELALRAQESLLGSVTGGNGAIYAVRRQEYVEVDPRFGHDLALPYLMVKRGRRAVYERSALAEEKPSRDLEDEYRRKLRMFEHCWLILLRGRMLRGAPPLYLLQLLSHRVLRYASGLLHAALLLTSAALVGLGAGLLYELVLSAQLALAALALAGRLRLRVPGGGVAYYYLLVTAATVHALGRTLRFGVPTVWEKAEGTR